MMRNERTALQTPLSDVKLVKRPSGKVGRSGLVREQLFEEVPDGLKDARDAVERVFFNAQFPPADVDVETTGTVIKAQKFGDLHARFGKDV